MKFGTFHFGDNVLFGDSIAIEDGSALASGWSFPFERWSYPAGEGWSWPNTGLSFPAGSGWSWAFGDWSYHTNWSYQWSYEPGFSYQWSWPNYISYPWWDGWSYKGEGWSYPGGYWSYDHVDNWSYQYYTGYSYPGGWSYRYGWSYPERFAIEREHITAGQVVLTSYLSAWWLNAVERGVDSTEAIGHAADSRVVPLDRGTLADHPKALGFKCNHLDAVWEPWVGQVAEDYYPNRRHVLSVYAWIDEVSDGDGELTLEADWGTGNIGIDDYSSASWNHTWAAQYDSNFRRMAPDGTVDSSHTIPAGKGVYRYWVTIPQKAEGYSIRCRIRALSGDFYTDQVKLEPERPLDVGQADSAGTTWLQDDSKSWAINQWAAKQVVITSGVTAPKRYDVSSNTYNRVYITAGWSLVGDETYEITVIGADSRPTAYVDEGMPSGWISAIKAENITGGLLTLGGSTVSGGVGGARLRVLDEDDNVIITLGENIEGDAYRGLDLKLGSGIRIASGSGGIIDVGNNVKITEYGFFGYDDVGSEIIAIRTTGEDRFKFMTSGEWKQRMEFGYNDGFQFFDDANVPFVSMNPATGTVYLGKEHQAHITITPDYVRVYADTLFMDSVVDFQDHGELRIGIGTPDTDFTGLRIYRNGSVYRFEGQYNGVPQVWIGSDGKEYAGGGDVRLDENGLSFLGGTEDPSNSITWYSGSDIVARTYAYETAGMGYFMFGANFEKDFDDGWANISAYRDTVSHDSSKLHLYADRDDDTGSYARLMVPYGGQIIARDTGVANVANFAFNLESYGGGKGVISIKDCDTAPTGNPVGGGAWFVENGALKYIGTSGAARTIVNADGTPGW